MKKIDACSTAFVFLMMNTSTKADSIMDALNAYSEQMGVPSFFKTGCF